MQDTDCLVLDIAMPGMTGPDLRDELQTRGCAIPIIFMTAQNDEANRSALLEQGASPELKEAYLREIASRANGVYAYEKDIEPVRAFLRQQIVSQQSSIPVPLVNFWNIFPLLAILILVGEWLLRRRLNLI